MNEEIKKLQPGEVWAHFQSLLNIPRPSKKETKVIAFMKNFGESLGLQTIVDEIGNVIIKKPATAGMENCKGIVLQGHLDMVPQKNSDKVHDFETDPIEAWVDGDWVKAKGTTLGADNGMGVAAAMAVLSSKTLKHGPVEALFTTDEETGMAGAFGLKPGLLTGDILLNLDSEDEGELYVGCAGGTNGTFTFGYQEVAVPAGHKAYDLTLKGLKGGHSGLDINLGRGNANKLVFRYLKHAIRKHDIGVACYEAGNLRNAIPREAFAKITVPHANEAKFLECIKEYETIFKKELSVTEPDLSFTATACALPQSLIDSDTMDRLVNAVYGCPNGVIRLSDTMPGLVETSTNLAMVKSEKGTITVLCLLRSSVDSAKEDLEEMMASVFALAKAEATFDGKYPGWKPNPDSLILNLMKSTYERDFGKTPDIKAIHAGLECGILGGAYPDWDMISFGPTIRHPHSPDEKVNVPSVQKFWDFLTATLASVPSRQ